MVRAVGIRTDFWLGGVTCLGSFFPFPYLGVLHIGCTARTTHSLPGGLVCSINHEGSAQCLTPAAWQSAATTGLPCRVAYVVHLSVSSLQPSASTSVYALSLSLSLSLIKIDKDMLRAILTQRRAISARWSVWKLAVMYVGGLMPPMFSIIQ